MIAGINMPMQLSAAIVYLHSNNTNTMKKLFLLSTAALGLTISWGQTTLPTILTCTNNPTAQFIAGSSCLGNPVMLTDASTSASGDPLSMWNWSMPGGNPTTSTSQITSTTYSTTGTHTVTLVVTSQMGCKDSISQSVIVYALPVANFSSSQNGNNVMLTDLSTSTDGNIVSWQWNLTGGFPSSSSAQNTTTTYPNSGTYTVCLTVNTVYGCTNTTCQPLTVTAVNEIYFTKMIHISPNPLTSQTVLQTDNPLHNATLTVYNCFGQAIKEIKNINGQSVVLARDNLPSGLYFIRLTENNITLAAEKLLITDK